MIYWNKDPEEDRSQIIRFEGQPKEPDQKGEHGLFKAFRRAFNKLGKGKLGIGVGPKGVNIEIEGERREDQQLEAETEKVKAEAKKFAAEAAEIQARLDEDPVVRAMQVNKELRNIFGDEKTPEQIKFLELLNLMDADPQLAAQWDKIESLAQRLNLLHGVQLFKKSSAHALHQENTLEVQMLQVLIDVGEPLILADIELELIEKGINESGDRLREALRYLENNYLIISEGDRYGFRPTEKAEGFLINWYAKHEVAKKGL